MGRIKVLYGAAIALMLGGCATPPAAMPTAQEALPETHQFAAQPEGFVGFCVRFLSQCKATPGGKSVITLDTQTWILLNAVNQTVNNAIWPEDDMKHYGRAEYWTIPTDGLGDCDDYAVTKRKDLIEAGLPAQALRLAVVVSQASGRHAVLTIATDKGDFVLDNLASDIRAWRNTDYTWIERQDAANPMRWVSLFPNYAAAHQAGATITASAAVSSTGQQADAPTSATQRASVQ